jgi:hypothetical protein
MPRARRRIILQPAGGPEATLHYERTIRQPVRLSEMLPVLSEEEATFLSRQFPTGWLRVWGVVPGAKNVNMRKWLQFAEGDCVLFCGQGHIFASATLRGRLHNKQLALNLWGMDDSGSTWELVYFVGDTRTQNISYARLGETIGYSRDYVVLGVNILSHDKSRLLFEKYDFNGD